jgi:hypothetical protein
MMPTFAPLPFTSPDAPVLAGALFVAGGGLLVLPPVLPVLAFPLELHPVTASAAAKPTTARPDTVLRMGSPAFLC